MYFNNAFGGGQGGDAAALTSPPNKTLASLLAQQQAQQPRAPMGGPQIPVAGAAGNMMAGAGAGPPSVEPMPQVGGRAPGGTTPGGSSLADLLKGVDPEKAKAMLQSLGLGDLFGSGSDFGGGGSGGGLLGGLFGGSSGGSSGSGLGGLFTHGNDGMAGFTGGGPESWLGNLFGS